MSKVQGNMMQDKDARAQGIREQEARGHTVRKVLKDMVQDNIGCMKVQKEITVINLSIS